MKIKNTSLIVFFGLCIVTFQLVASNIGFLKYAVISEFTEDDIQQLQHNYVAVLNDHKPGEELVWKNDKTGSGGEITVIRQYMENENKCKRLKFKNHSKKQSAVSYFNFCLIEKQWKVVN